MRRGRLLFLLYLLVLPQGVIWGQKAKPKSAAGKPSLDQLAARVETYWNLLLERRKAKASEYVIASEREKFLDRIIPRFENPQLKSLAPAADKSEAKVTVIVKRVTSLGIMDWPIAEQWVFKNGNWFIQPNQEVLPGSEQKISKMEQEDAQKAALRKKLQFEKSVLDFGLVKQGTTVILKLKYTLDGDEEVVARIEKSSPYLAVEGLKGFSLATGKSVELTVKLATQKLEGIVQEKITLRAKTQDVVVEYPIAVQGYVYVPVSVDQKILRLNPDKEAREKEILVRNNTGTPLVLESFSIPSGAAEVEGLPITIPAHQQGAIKVKQTQKAERPDSAEILMIAFAQPVDDMSLLRINLVLDASDTRDGVIYDPFKDPNIREQIRKNVVTTPKR
jgi:hypothetical protein